MAREQSRPKIPPDNSSVPQLTPGHLQNAEVSQIESIPAGVCLSGMIILVAEGANVMILEPSVF